MVARNIRDTVREKDATRLKAHLDGWTNDRGARKVIEYSDGTEVTTERTAPGANRPDGRPALKEVRTIVKVKTPSAQFYGGIGDTKYKRGLVFEPDEEERTTNG